jgi:hypothetical protein
LRDSFALKFHEDFLPVYMDNYMHNGLEGELLEDAQQGKLRMDENTEALVHYFRFLENQIIGNKD